MKLSNDTRMLLVGIAAACIFVTWLISSTMGPPVRTDSRYNLLRTPYGTPR